MSLYYTRCVDSLHLVRMRIPMKADTCSNPYRTPFRACRTVVGAKRRSEGVIKGCPTGVKVLPRFNCDSDSVMRHTGFRGGQVRGRLFLGAFAGEQTLSGLHTC